MIGAVGFPATVTFLRLSIGISILRFSRAQTGKEGTEKKDES